jgi:hypothetical protein
VTLVTDVPNGLGILSQPTNGTAGEAISSALDVNVVDNSNNTVTTDNTQVVALSIASGPAGAVLSGTTTVRAVNGVARFTGLSLDLAGTYVPVATVGDLTPVYTSPITIAPVPIVGGLSIRRGPLLVAKQGGSGRARSEVVEQTITITITSRLALRGPVGLEINGLTAAAKLSNANGSFEGVPDRDILRSGGSLAPNQSASVTLDFTIEGNASRNLQSIYESIEAMLGL